MLFKICYPNFRKKMTIMKEIFLSFNPKYFKPLLYGIKKYEYRKRFCNEETLAYLYLSGKSKCVIGLLELGKPIRLDKTRDNYIEYLDTLNRVDKYISSKDINAVPIKSLSLFENSISLEKIRDIIPKFMPPQMYYNLDNKPKLKEILNSRKIKEKLFIHNHEKIYYDNLAKSVSELEKTKEFININNSNIYKDILNKINI